MLSNYMQKESLFQEIASFFLKQQLIHYKKGEIIVRVGEPPTGVYFIEKGYVKIYSLTESGEENIQFIYRPGEFFPLAWTFNDKEVNFYYEALTNVTLRKSTRDALLTYITDNPRMGLITVQYVVGILDAFFHRLNNVELTHSYPRIISRLLFLAERYGKEVNGETVFDMPITQKDIANSINLTRETASKEMNTLVKKGIITCKDRSSLVIHNIAALEKELLLHYERKSL